VREGDWGRVDDTPTSNSCIRHCPSVTVSDVLHNVLKGLMRSTFARPGDADAPLSVKLSSPSHRLAALVVSSSQLDSTLHGRRPCGRARNLQTYRPAQTVIRYYELRSDPLYARPHNLQTTVCFTTDHSTKHKFFRPYRFAGVRLTFCVVRGAFLLFLWSGVPWPFMQALFQTL